MRNILKALLIPAAFATAAAAGIATTASANSLSVDLGTDTTTYYYYYTPPPTTYYYYIERPMRCHLGVCY